MPPASAVISSGFILFAIFSVLLTSLAGSVCNSFLFYKFVARNTKSNGFQKICLIKTMTNFSICASFLFWVVPVTALRFTYNDLNYIINRSIAVLSSTWSYFLNSLLQVCMSCNRFYALYFPFGIKKVRNVAMTNWAIIGSIVLVCIFSALTIPGMLSLLIGSAVPWSQLHRANHGMIAEGCGYVYDPGYLVWRAEDAECANRIAVFVPPIIFGTTITTNCFNVATAVRLLMDKMVGMSKEDSKRRRKRWMIMFTQSVIQDCLQLIDTINSYYLWKLSSAIWFQFLFVTLSFITVTALDGFVMFICNSDVHPKWMRPKRNGMAITAILGKASFTNAN